MGNRLARTFNPQSGGAVMLAVDHGYFQGPTTGLECITSPSYRSCRKCDALFCTRGNMAPKEAFELYNSLKASP